MNARGSSSCHFAGRRFIGSLGSLKSGSINIGLTLRSKARRRMRCIMKSRRHVSVLDTNREHDGRAVHPAHLRTHRSPATVALPFALMCAIIGGGNICQSLSWDARRSQRVSAYLGVFGTCRRRLLSLCSDVRQVSILKHLRCEDGNLHRHRRVKCHASAGTNFRWTTTDAHR